MQSPDVQLLNFALASGTALTLATLVGGEGALPRAPGAMLAVRPDGSSAGAISGGCTDAALLQQLRGWLPARPCLLGPEGAEALAPARLACGGRLSLLIEGLRQADTLAPALAAARAGRRVSRDVELQSGRVSYTAAGPEDCTRVEAGWLRRPFGAAWRLLVIGAGPLAGYLVPMAGALDFAVTLCEPRPEMAAAAAAAGVPVLSLMPDDAVRAMAPDRWTAVLALTHDSSLDDLALIEALPGAAFYVGALGSRANNRRRRERLVEHFGLREPEVARLHGPVGLALGARSAPEISLAILAELVALRNGLQPAAAAQSPRPPRST